MVSLHDVHPASWHAYRPLLDELADAGVDRVALLAVPRWRGMVPVDGSEDLSAWLRRSAAEGHEVCLHGLTHHADTLPRGLVSGLVGRYYTDREGEFHRLGYDEALRRLREGRAILARAGLHVDGFTPPAWLAGPGVTRALADLEFAYTTTLGSVLLPLEGASIPAPVLSFSTRALWRTRTSGLVVPAMARLFSRARVLRIAVHPRDLAIPAIRASLLSIVRRAAAMRRVTTYGELARAAVAVGVGAPAPRTPQS